MTEPTKIRYKDTGLIFENASGTDSIVIDSNSNVGIGTTAPTAKLTVYGDSTEDTASRLLLKVHDKVANNEWTGIGLGGYSTSTKQVCKSAIIHERTDGHGRGSLHLCTNNGGDENDVTKSDARLTVKADGNVGIGVQPDQRLEVAGCLKISTNTPPGVAVNTVLIFGINLE